MGEFVINYVIFQCPKCALVWMPPALLLKGSGSKWPCKKCRASLLYKGVVEC